MGRLWTRCAGGTEYRLGPCRAFFESLARAGVWQTPTIVTLREGVVVNTPMSTIGVEQLAYATRSLKAYWASMQQVLRPSPAITQVLRAQADVHAAVTADLAEIGVGILAGCDYMVPGFCLHDELALMVRGGMSTLAALQTATVNPARHLGLTQTLGTVDVDKEADLVVLDANPLTDIANLKRIRAVVVRGRALERPALDAVLAEVKAVAATQ